MKIGIDASNIRAGGGITHLKELLNHSNPESNAFAKILVFASKSTLSQLPDYPWLEKKHDPYLNGNFITRLIWEWFIFPVLYKRKVDILFNPGGTFVGGFHPYVSMSQNMLVFDKSERARFGISFNRVRLKFLNYVQRASFKSADGVIFISDYARETISRKTKIRSSTVISHGISRRFSKAPAPTKHISEYSSNNPFRILYVSIINVYKHQWNVAAAVQRLREKDNLAIEITFVGGGVPSSLSKLTKIISQIKDGSVYLRMAGKVPFEDIHEMYKRSDLFVYASTCENMPNIVLEAMSASMPIASSSYRPMPDFLKEAAVYFDPLNVDDIYLKLKSLIQNQSLRTALSAKAFSESSSFSWERCAAETFSYLHLVLDRYRNTSK